MHDAAEAVVVVDRIVHRATIVPESERTHFPSEAAGEFRLDLVLPQEPQQRQAFGLGTAPNAGRVCVAGIKRLTSGFGMGAYNWMLGLQHLGRRARTGLPEGILACPGNIGLG